MSHDHSVDHHRVDGFHIEAGWLDFYSQMQREMSQEEFDHERWLFFCGALYLYDTIARLLRNPPNAGSAATMQQIHTELTMFQTSDGRAQLDS